MSTIEWISAKGGDWSTGADWSSGVVPTSSDDAVIAIAPIAGAASYAVNVAGAAFVHNLTLDNSRLGFVVKSGGVLNLGGTLSIEAGTLNLNKGGTIRGGTIAANGAVFYNWTGTLDGVTFDGPVAFNTGGPITIADGLTLRTADGSGPGRLDMGATLIFEGVQTIDNASINGHSSSLQIGDAASSATLTLGAGLMANSVKFTTGSGAGPYDLINLGQITDSEFSGNFGSVVNKGAITFNGAEIVASSFENDGVLDGSNFSISAQSSAAQSFVNKGTIRFTDFLSLYFTSATTADLGSIVNMGGTIQLAGERLGSTLDNTGAVLVIGTGSDLGALSLLGLTITGGTIQDLGAGIGLFSGPTFDGVTYEGTLALGIHSSYVPDRLTIANGITVTGKNGTGPGAILIEHNAELDFTDATTLDNITITGSAGGGMITTKSVLTFGPHLTINGNSGIFLAGTIVNDGTINTFGGGTRYSFTNNGTIEVALGGIFAIDGAGFTNLAGTTLTGGIYDVRAGAALDIIGSASAPLPGIVTLDAEVILVGTNSTMFIQNAGQVSLDDTLTTIGAAGKLRLLGGRSFASTLAISDNGLLQLGGGTFAAASLTITPSGSLTGFGTVTAPITNGGTVEAASGVLDLAGGLSGTGKAEIAPAATLEIAGSTAVPAVFLAASGILELDDAAGFTGTISGLRIGDTIRLEDVAATQATIHGSTLAVTLAGGGEIDYAVAGNFAKAVFAIQNGGHDLVLSSASPGGTATILEPTNVAVAQLTQAMAGVRPTGSSGSTAPANDLHANNPLLTASHA